MDDCYTHARAAAVLLRCRVHVLVSMASGITSVAMQRWNRCVAIEISAYVPDLHA
jgi:hypothetical protein